MYGEMYKDALSPVICVIVRRHLSTLIRTATFEIPDQLPIRINPTIDSTQILCRPTVRLSWIYPWFGSPRECIEFPRQRSDSRR